MVYVSINDFIDKPITLYNFPQLSALNVLLSLGHDHFQDLMRGPMIIFSYLE